MAVRSGLGLPALEIQSSDSSKESDSDGESERESERELSDADGSAAAAFADTVEEETLFTEYFKLKGSTYHDHFQKALRQCKRLMLDKKEVAVQLVIEPANVADENAIIVQAELDSMWHPVGYIPGVKVKKAMNAINKEEIKTIRYPSLPLCFSPGWASCLFSSRSRSFVHQTVSFFTLARCPLLQEGSLLFCCTTHSHLIFSFT